VFSLRFRETVRCSKLLADGCRQLEARADPELLVGAAEVALDGLLGYEQRLRDLTVGVPLSHLAAYAQLRRGQRARPAQLSPRTTPRSGVQLRPCALGQRDRTALVS
jgi:hypothetical protein